MNRSTLLALVAATLIVACGRERAPGAAGIHGRRRPRRRSTSIAWCRATWRWRNSVRGRSRWTGSPVARPRATPWCTPGSRRSRPMTRWASHDCAISRDEFAWLYYPTAKQGLPPYDLSPSLMWFVLDGGSNKGEARLLQDRGGKPLHVVGYTCDPQSSAEGENTSWGPCTLKRVPAKGDTTRGATVRADRGTRRGMEVPELQGEVRLTAPLPSSLFPPLYSASRRLPRRQHHVPRHLLARGFL